jgi:ATP-binding cassette subfamily F protein 3
MYESQQQRVAHLQSYIDRFRAKATKAKQAQSRIKMLERMELIAPAHVDNPFHFSFRAPESLPNPLLKMEKVSAGYGERLFSTPSSSTWCRVRASACWAQRRR